MSEDMSVQSGAGEGFQLTHPHCSACVRRVTHEDTCFGATVELVDEPGVDCAKREGTVFIRLLDRVVVFQEP